MEKQLTYEEEKQRETFMAEVMESDRLAKIEAEESIEAGKFSQREAAKDMCLKQIRAREEARKESRIEFEKERAMVDDVVRKIRDEDEAEEALRRQKQEETRLELQSFAERQTQWRAEQEARAAAENEEIEAYARMKREREAAIEAEKKRIEEEKRRLFFAMVGDMEKKSKEKEEMEYLRNELYHEEHEAEVRRKEKQKEEKRLADRADMLAAYESQMARRCGGRRSRRRRSAWRTARTCSR